MGVSDVEFYSKFTFFIKCEIGTTRKLIKSPVNIVYSMA